MQLRLDQSLQSQVNRGCYLGTGAARRIDERLRSMRGTKRQIAAGVGLQR